jgi:hypothetical protein
VHSGGFVCGLPIAVAVGGGRDHAGRTEDGSSRYEPQQADRPEFQAFDFTHDRRTYEVFRGGSGPAVLVLHEIPGLHPGVIDFAHRLSPLGTQCACRPRSGGPQPLATGRAIVRSILRVLRGA